MVSGPISMFYAATDNMKRDENRLIEHFNTMIPQRGGHGKNKVLSNAPTRCGVIYVLSARGRSRLAAAPVIPVQRGQCGAMKNNGSLCTFKIKYDGRCGIPAHQAQISTCCAKRRSGGVCPNPVKSNGRCGIAAHQAQKRPASIST